MVKSYRMNLRGINSFSFCGNVIISGLMIAFLSHYLFRLGWVYSSILLVVYWFGILLWGALESVELKYIGGYDCIIVERSFLRNKRHILDLRKNLIFYYGGNGFGMTIDTGDGGRLDLSIPRDHGGRIERVIYELRKNLNIKDDKIFA